ncbi:hypothetical protein [Paraburkholderia caballeronis]|uniref:hypothetical protein n=1 Tax=Paraburkholderia caballeronis TaxID=416943 RepID=UPI001431DD1C|nr:hypothetical protein [Paraburkholderia caballeronis]
MPADAHHDTRAAPRERIARARFAPPGTSQHALPASNLRPPRALDADNRDGIEDPT